MPGGAVCGRLVAPGERADGPLAACRPQAVARCR